MTNKELNKNRGSVEQYLTESKIKNALDLLGKVSSENHAGKLIDDHYNIEFTYKTLLQYAVEGVVDPEQKKMYNKVLRDTYTLSDSLFDLVKTKHSSELYYDIKRYEQDTLPLGIGSIIDTFYDGNKLESSSNVSEILIKKNDTLLDDVFSYIMVHDIDSNMLEILYNKIFTDEVDYSYQSAVVGALTIGCLHQFSLNKILCLIKLLDSENEELRQRSMVGVLLLLNKYDDRLKLYPTLVAQLELMADNSTLLDDMSHILINLLRTKETEKIGTTLTEEILPEVVKMEPNLRNRFNSDNMPIDDINDGENPDWSDIFDDMPDLKDKIEELTEWHLEGADVLLTTFKPLKSFSFFSNLKNWFIPFSLSNANLSSNNLSEIISNNSIQSFLGESGYMCNSDKFSLLFSFEHMPESQREMMMSMLNQQLEQSNEIEKDEKFVDPSKYKANINNRYIQDLYRFYKLHPRKNDFVDIFNQPMDFYNKFFYKTIFSQSNNLPQIADFLFKKQYFKEASDVFEILSSCDTENVELLQRRAYCFQQLGKFSEALELYLKADILKPNMVWTVKKIALMHKKLGNTKNALNYYLEAENIKPDNLHTQTLIAHCYFDLKEYDKALKYYFKVEYLDKNSSHVWNPIAWCSFISSNYEQAERYYTKMINEEPKSQYYIDLGHVYFCTNRRKEAFECYKNALSRMENKADFFKEFNLDIKSLIDKGIEQREISIMIDQMRYFEIE